MNKMVKHDKEMKKKLIITNMRKEPKKFALAPIIVFAYNRADKLEQLLTSLERNAQIKNMDLYIFVDIPDKKNRKDRRYNQQVITFLKKYQSDCKMFKKITIEISDKHRGLADSIIHGVTKIVNQYGKVIVLEDDLKVSEDFLDYMQRGLEIYKNDSRIWAVAGYCPVFKMPGKYKKDVFLVPRPESWGWGTWSERWNRCHWEVSTYQEFRKDILKRILFNIGGDDLGPMLKRQMENAQYNSWAIRWGYQQFLERKYTVYPKESRVIHCGTDNRSTHGAYFDTQVLKDNYKRCRFSYLRPDWNVIWHFRKAYRITLRQRVRSFANIVKNQIFTGK